MTDDRLAALERHAQVMTEGLTLAIDHVRALTTVNAALMAALDGADRTAIRVAALADLGDGPEHKRARGLIEAITQGPAAAVADHQATLTFGLLDVPPRLQ
ncbi:hypothetical protein MKK84_14450 [Methylobacterium sp. E-065]|uniref:hypothetical protein n=1 Tax=Methylobacterium sp. E-065 TaxID=2836583 RepID=UPI001FBC0FDF|nr:hypothetical protein [Methylobacterium sp. E-065]MCJ2018623.1 hypothetical protein [Methylobacterium sp. E-065]